MSTPLLLKIRAALRAIADPKRAPAMQAYMKSTMPYHGVSAGEMRAVAKRVFAEHELGDAASWRADVLAIWNGATHREERYVAIALCGDKRARPFQTLDALPMYEHMIVSGAWWDYADELATHRVGDLLRAHPAAMKRHMLAWSKSSMWKARTSIICQNRSKADTDLELLYACIEPSLASKEFFLRKAMGWALREVAWRDPKEVKRYVKAHDAELSGLSKREALKNV